MDTPFLYGQEDDNAVAYLKSVAIGGRLTKIEDIAPLVKFLITEGKWITGEYEYLRLSERAVILKVSRSNDIRKWRICHSLGGC